MEALAQGEMPEAEVPGGVGSRGIKYEARELALGDRDYIDDLRPEGLLHAALHLSEHARADIVRIDTSAAEAMDGVEAVFTAADVPGELRVGIIHTDWPVFIPEGGRTSYVGDVLAIVVADSRATARRAAEAVQVTYEVHTPITDPVAAVTNGCDDAVWELDGNVLSRSVYARGDVDAALAAQRPHHPRGVPNPAPSSTPSWSRSPPWPCPTATAPCTSTPAARGCGTTATRWPRCWPSSPSRSPWSW